MNTVHRLRPLRYRTIFISDTHLGFRGARADFLLDFLRATDCETLYLVGDIFDIWEMERRGIHWPREHNLVVKTIFEKAANGTRVIYVPGNHDEAMREYDGTVIDNLHVHRQALHETADGRRFLVLHGDEFDAVVQCSKLVALMGSRIYDWLLRANYWINLIRRRLGFPYWSLAAHVKHKVKNAVSYISNFEEAVAYEARRQGVDGLVCGHIHHAEMRTINGVLYCNDGDWVESCTALVEDFDGRLELLRWTDAEQTVHALEPAAEVGEQAA
ncbi:UDP-2,3-diacylglucosamine diphosphatase [Ectothiorhodospiraceae bacterium WFHF3C12]|nr:UDP-2,3-diacylglucosamine diphosphatase [Ectothiorhodospiraceae bacterium WFHF3C12]